MNPRLCRTLAGLLVSALPLAVVAEEGGSGHYFPGSMASFMDGVSPVKTFITRLNVIDYSGNFGANREVPIAGLTVLDVDVKSMAYGLTMFWRPSWGNIGEKWSFAVLRSGL